MTEQPRDDLHQLINELAESDVSTVRRLLRSFRPHSLAEVRDSELGQPLDGPIEEDEELTPKEMARLKAAVEAWRYGDVAYLDDLSRKLGIMTPKAGVPVQPRSARSSPTRHRPGVHKP